MQGVREILAATRHHQPPVALRAAQAGDGSPVARCGRYAFRCCDYVCGNWDAKSGRGIMLRQDAVLRCRPNLAERMRTLCRRLSL